MLLLLLEIKDLFNFGCESKLYFEENDLKAGVFCDVKMQVIVSEFVFYHSSNFLKPD